MSIWIQDDTSLRETARAVGEGPLALDLEADSFHHYYEKVCLVQISFRDTHLLLDPLSDVDVGILRPVVEDGAVRKILHGADYDLRILHRDFGFQLSGLFDTMVAARLTGERAFGLAALLDKHLNVKLDKSHQRADWSRRPLPDAMVRYALEDTRHLEDLAGILEDRLAEQGRRSWAEEEFGLLEAVRWNGRTEDGEAYLRVKGARTLDPRSLAVLRELYRFRDEAARRRDVPPFKIMSESLLVDLARKRPEDIEALERFRGLHRAHRRGKGVANLLAAVRRGIEASPLRPPTNRKRTRPSNSRTKRLREVQKRRDAIAGDLDLEPTLLASRKVLETVLERTDSGEDWRDAEGLRRWQASLLEPVLDAL